MKIVSPFYSIISQCLALKMCPLKLKMPNWQGREIVLHEIIQKSQCNYVTALGALSEYK